MADPAILAAEDDEDARPWWLPLLFLVGGVLVSMWVYDKVANPGLMRTGGFYTDGGGAAHGSDHEATSHGSDDHSGTDDGSADHAGSTDHSAAEENLVGIIAPEDHAANDHAATAHSGLEAAGVNAALADDITNDVAPEGMNDEAAGEALTFERTLGEYTLRGAEGGVEERLIAFIESDREPCTEADCWFTFDRLTFGFGSAELEADQSAQQLDNLEAIMRAYPTIELKFGGYTDNQGDHVANLDLSQRRAEAVSSAMVARGFDASRLGAEGYGEEFPVASNETVQGRAQNRRVDVRVRSR